jgi:HD-GYP domain-containing protein (c-di-GMP phosphodiesterase class II)
MKNRFFDEMEKKERANLDDQLMLIYAGEFANLLRQLAQQVKTRQFWESEAEFKAKKREKIFDFFRRVAAENYRQKIAELAARAKDEQTKWDEFFEWMAFFFYQQRMELAAAIRLMHITRIDSMHNLFLESAENDNTEVGGKVVAVIKQMLEQSGDGIALLSNPDSHEYLIDMMRQDLLAEAAAITPPAPMPTQEPKPSGDSNGDSDGDNKPAPKRDDDNNLEF